MNDDKTKGMFKKKGRFCYYTGGYYCKDCHAKQQTYIPSRIVFMWDLRPQMVCKAAYEEIKSLFNDPILDLSSINPKIFTSARTQLAPIKAIRDTIAGTKDFIMVCKSKDELLKVFGNRLYLLDNPSLFSLSDLVAHSQSKLINYLERIQRSILTHIARDCLVCLPLPLSPPPLSLLNELING